MSETRNLSRPVVTAIPLSRDCIAFHFAWCTHVLLVTTLGERVLKREMRTIPYADPWDMARTLVLLDIDQLVCKTVPDYFRDWFESKGVRIIDEQNRSTRTLFKQYQQAYIKWKVQDGKQTETGHVPSAQRTESTE